VAQLRGFLERDTAEARKVIESLLKSDHVPLYLCA
jgi:hypothetical protein